MMSTEELNKIKLTLDDLKVNGNFIPKTISESLELKYFHNFDGLKRLVEKQKVNLNIPNHKLYDTFKYVVTKKSATINRSLSFISILFSIGVVIFGVFSEKYFLIWALPIAIIATLLTAIIGKTINAIVKRVLIIAIFYYFFDYDDDIFEVLIFITALINIYIPNLIRSNRRNIMLKNALLDEQIFLFLFYSNTLVIFDNEKNEMIYPKTNQDNKKDENVDEKIYIGRKVVENSNVPTNYKEPLIKFLDSFEYIFVKFKKELLPKNINEELAIFSISLYLLNQLEDNDFFKENVLFFDNSNIEFVIKGDYSESIFYVYQNWKQMMIEEIVDSKEEYYIDLVDKRTSQLESANLISVVNYISEDKNKLSIFVDYLHIFLFAEEFKNFEINEDWEIDNFEDQIEKITLQSFYQHDKMMISKMKIMNFLLDEFKEIKKDIGLKTNILMDEIND